MSALPECHAFLATSLDGYIALPDGDVRWLTSLPVPEGEDFGYAAFIGRMDAILMGSGSFNKALEAETWPYNLPVTVLSGSLTAADLPRRLHGKVEISSAPLPEALTALAGQGAARIYADGGQLESSLLREGLLRSLTLTRVPVLLGAGLPLFNGSGPATMRLEAVHAWGNGFVQTTYRPAI
jgi:dihydrofolate reductase